ncbi:MAG: undecaprenyl/decaprenyl-phosphate alpha-N-acetylglucosaminyl 1-phosphate transferase [Planctomycetes bacterium]|nr:undecaprenyl/decaprenyl-phosphate alpha-N-acetylglucosaminyl 1-phosphate transferase [Planctomycetota bacterium]
MTSILNHPHLALLVLSWLVADLLGPLLIRLAHRVGALDRPRAYKAHASPVPYLGGVVIYLAFAIAIASTIRFVDLRPYRSVVDYILRGHGDAHTLFGIVLGATFVLVVGLLDDIRPINAVFKLAILLIATAVLHRFGLVLHLFPDQVSGIPAAWLNVPLTLFWIVGVTSATNSLDNTDGVVTGVSAIAATATFFVAWGDSATSAQPWLSYLAVTLLGCCLGLLRYNFVPARIYLGDNGAFLLGFLLACMLVKGEWARHPVKAIVVPCLIMTVPLFDICLSTVLRIVHGRVGGVLDAILYCGRDHLAHRLMALGYSKTHSVLLLYLMAAIAGALAIVVHKERSGVLIAFYLAVYLAALAYAGWRLDRAPVYEATSPPEGPREGATH